MNKRWLVTIVIVVAVGVILAVVFGTVLGNHQPAISGLEANPENVIPLGSCQIVCNAVDGDGDQLSYNWSASDGEINGEGDVVTWTAPDSAGSYNVTVTVTDGNGGEVTDYIIIEVRANKPPIITSLVADAEWTLPSHSTQVTCTASDPDEDVLSYEWTTDGGDISSEGATANWTAPQEVGTYNITVVVKDSYGGEAIGKLPLSVNLGTPPAIEKLCITPEEHPYLRDSSTSGCDYDVWKNRDYSIECFASDTGELVYDWSCTDGEISGEGSTITWTAPNKTLVKITVTVMVSDAEGNSVSKNMVLHVASCTCGSWGLESGCK
jgi:hypothetical protein